MGRRRKHPALQAVAAGLLIVGMLLWFFAAMGNLNRDSGEEGREQLEKALRRAAAACYAAEGVYPPTLDDLTDRYGVQIGDRYIVFYEIFASNLMPDITVLEKGA